VTTSQTRVWPTWQVTALRRLLAYALATGSLLLYGAVVLASEHVYDIPTIARHGVQSLDIVEAGSGQFTEAHARSASPPTSSRGRSTTAFATFVATNNGVDLSLKYKPGWSAEQIAAVASQLVVWKLVCSSKCWSGSGYCG
jgi:hypothetical protein